MARGAVGYARGGTDGRFKLSLPSGAYRVTSRSPLMQSWQMIFADPEHELLICKPGPRQASAEELGPYRRQLS